MTDRSLESAVHEILRRLPDLSVREIRSELRERIPDVPSKSEVNSVLYQGLSAGDLFKSDDQPPRWRLFDAPALEATPVVTAKQDVIAIFLEASGQEWTAAQRAAAADGTAVTRLTSFTADELREAASMQESGPLDWARWFDDAIAVRSRGIRL